MELNDTKSFVVGLEWNDDGTRKDTDNPKLLITTWQNATQKGTGNAETEEEDEDEKKALATAPSMGRLLNGLSQIG